MEVAKKLTNLQLELIKMFGYEVSNEQLAEIRSILSNYFANQITSEVDKLFEANKWGEEKIEEWAEEHMRTPYNTVK